MNPIELELLQMMYEKISSKTVEKYKSLRVYVYYSIDPGENKDPDSVLVTIGSEVESFAPGEMKPLFMDLLNLEGTYKLKDGRVFNVNYSGMENSYIQSVELLFDLVEDKAKLEDLQHFIFFNDTQKDIFIHSAVRLHGIQYEGESTIKHLEAKTFYLPLDYVPMVKMWSNGIMIMNGRSLT